MNPLTRILPGTFMLFLATSISFAQQSVERIWVTFESAEDVPTMTEGELRSSNPSIQGFIDQFSIKQVEQVVPTSAKESLRKVYEVSCDCDADVLIGEIELHSNELTNPIAAPEHTLLNDPNDYNLTFSTDYALDLINAKEAWNFSIGDESTIIGICDANYYLLHEDLEGKVASTGGYNTSTNYYHGTAVAITAAGDTDNAAGKSSIGYNCQLKLIGMNYNELLQMSQEGIRVINISWSCGCSPNVYLQSIFNEMYENGTIVVAAAGNGSTCGGPTNPVYPAAFDNVISVTSIGPNDNHEQIPGDSTSTHQHNASVDLCAPGYSVPISIAPGYYMNATGSSFASPMVAGTIGLMLSLRPCLTATEIEEILMFSSDDIYAANPSYAGQLGWGRLNAAKALELTELTGCINNENPSGTNPDVDDTLLVNSNAGSLSGNTTGHHTNVKGHKEDKLKQNTQQLSDLDVNSIAEVLVFPNPTKGSTILLTDFSDPVELTLRDAQGRIIDVRKVDAGENKTALEFVQSGVYFLSISRDGVTVWFERVVKL